jgi:nucleotide-binding universal stress UspA family protein
MDRDFADPPQKEETPEDFMQSTRLTPKATATLQTASPAHVPATASSVAAPVPPALEIKTATEAPAATKRVVAVVSSDDRLNREVIRIATAFARSKHAELTAIYGVEVPLSLDLNIATSRDSEAKEILQGVRQEVDRYDYDVTTEVLRVRDMGIGVVDMAMNSHCALLVIGEPFREMTDGSVPLDESVSYILQHATCRVMLIRGGKDC